MIRKKKEAKKIVIDLTGPDGNAFALIGYAKRLSTQLGKDYAPVASAMMGGDYENLLKVFDKEFGEYVILER
jgi:hypothetical protein